MIKTVHHNPLKWYTRTPFKPFTSLHSGRCAIPSIDNTIFFNDRKDWKKGKKGPGRDEGGGHFREVRSDWVRKSTGNAQNPPRSPVRRGELINSVHTRGKQARDRCTFLIGSTAEMLLAWGKTLIRSTKPTCVGRQMHGGRL